MTTLRYAIIQVGDVWKIVCERRHIGHFANREAASRAGAQLAREAANSGYDIELLVQGMFGEIAHERFQARGPAASTQATPPAV